MPSWPGTVRPSAVAVHHQADHNPIVHRRDITSSLSTSTIIPHYFPILPYDSPPPLPPPSSSSMHADPRWPPGDHDHDHDHDSRLQTKAADRSGSCCGARNWLVRSPPISARHPTAMADRRWLSQPMVKQSGLGSSGMPTVDCGSAAVAVLLSA
ncbi:hypothetical protein BO71DRAFT_109375 [Aspergillus ellipticus CBS 707.79]|uniref:Uncharacterized protein n=1 Tax=Aspergillus ellipticus CBS 707.79 TaxID=1448320 RepID=A0A319CVR9_9EURO|nr:hypothetical protein BO71DRAFT_109375 [Aspergillus ellipticus CBS 707.79]